MINYMRQLTTSHLIIDKKIKDSTLKSVVNMTALFLNIACENCQINLIDPIGIKVIQSNKSMRHARCGNCGYYGFVSYYS